MTKFASEVEMMKPLVEHFRGMGCELRENLPVKRGRKLFFPDLVVIRENGDLEVFEGKLRLTDEVIAQAQEWRNVCRRSYVVVPAPSGEDVAHSLRRETIRTLNLGLVYIKHHQQAPEFQIQFHLYRNPKPQLDLLLNAMEVAPPASTDKPAGAPSVHTPRAIKKFGDVIAHIEEFGEASARMLEFAGVLKRGQRMQLIKAIQYKELPQLEYTGPGGVFRLAGSEVTA